MSAENAENPVNSPAPVDPLRTLKITAKIVGICYVLLLIVFAVCVFSRPDAANVKFDSWLHSSSWPYVFTVVNCFLLFLFLYLGLKAPILGMLDKAIQKTVGDLLDARNATAEAGDIERQNQKLSADLAAEQQRLDADLEIEKKKDAERIVAQARAEAQAILDNAKLSLNADLESARRQLREEIVTQALDEAKRKLNSELTSADRDAVFDALIDDLEKQS